MARPYPSDTLQPKGKLELENGKPGFYRAFFTPPVEALPKQASPGNYRRPILDINTIDKRLTIYPFVVWSLQPMTARYYSLKSINLDLRWSMEAYFAESEDIETLLSEELPDAFIEDYNYGLGFRKSYRPIATMLEQLEIKTLDVTWKGSTEIDLDAKKVCIKRSDLERMCKCIDSITQRAQRVSASLKAETISGLFLQLLSGKNPEEINKGANIELAKRMGSARLTPGGANKKEQKDAIEVIRKNGKKIMNEQPSELIKLRNDIELVTLEQLISKFEAMLTKQLPESHWQKLFDENPFILNMAFGIPILKVQGQVSVGGRKLSGAGDKIADFLVKNSITNNTAIIEIKTPATKLISPKEYRSGVFSPSIELSGAINQILDQIFQFQNEITSLKFASREYDLESYAVTGILIAGVSLTGSDEQKSFELYRGNSKNIQIITFDELLAKLKDLYSFLCPVDGPKPAQTQDTIAVSDDDLPF